MQHLMNITNNMINQVILFDDIDREFEIAPQKIIPIILELLKMMHKMFMIVK